jgi:pimeloyl-ACP methyl ester carboxylesterase
LKSGKQKLFKIVSIVVGVLLVAYLVVCAFGAREAMAIPRLPLTLEPSSLGVPCEDVSFTTRGDGLTLKGWFLPGAGKQAIIMVHGGFQNRIDTKADTPGLARALVDKGYSVLLYDLRGRGESEGKGISLSHIDEDIGGAVDYIGSRGFGIKDIAIMGFSSGAVMTCIYGSRNEVGALILDGCFIDGATMVVRQGEYIHVPVWFTNFLMPGGILLTRLLYGYHKVDAIDVISSVKSPILFIQEQDDVFTRLPETQKLLDTSVNPANQIWEAAGAGHSQAFSLDPQEYIDTIDGFLQKLR